MNQCKKFQNMFYEYIDGTLAKADEVQLLEHLETCAQCKEEFMFVKEVEQELHNIPMAPLPENFNAKLRENLTRINLEKPEEKKRSFLKWLPKYGLAVSAAAAFAIMIMAYSGNFKLAEYPSGSDSSLPVTATSSPDTTEYNTGSEQPDTQPVQQEKTGTADSADAGSNAAGKQGSAPTKAPAKQSGSATKKPAAVQQTKAPVSSAAPQAASNEAASGSDSTIQTDKSSFAGGGAGGSSAVSAYAGNVASARSTQGLIFVIHSTVDSQTLKQLYALPTFQVVGGNRYQMQRSYQNELIKALKNLEYSIHFSSETSRIDKDAVIIELI